MLGDERKKTFHTFTMKGMFLAKRARQDMQPGITFLSTRTTEPTEEDWKKLVRILGYLKKTEDTVLTLEADDHQRLVWHVDAAFGVHPDFRSHTGATFSMGKGCITSFSLKQKVNTRSSTKAELVLIDDVLAKIIWTLYFIQHQGFNVSANMVYRDNTSSMKLEQNGKESSGKRTRHFNIKWFYVTDLIKRKLIKIEYCPTQDMIPDYMSKPTV